MAEAAAETVSTGNEPTVQQTISKKPEVVESGPGGVVVLLNGLAAAASIVFAFLLYLIWAKPM